MRSMVVQVAAALGLDPFTFVMLMSIAGLCAFLMKEMLPDPWMAFAFYPLLFAGGLAFIGLAALCGLIDPIEIWIDSDGDLRADWKRVADAIPAVLVSSMTGMCVSSLGIIQIMRSLGRHF